MRNYWYMIALTIVVAMIAKYFSEWVVIFLWLIWICYLFFHIPQRVIICMLISFSYFYITLPIPIPQANVYEENVAIDINGKIASQVKKTGKQLSFTINDEANAQKLSVVYFMNQAEQESGQEVASLVYGATCTVTGTIRATNGARNPYQFDYGDYLIKKQISAQLVVAGLDKISCKHTSVHLLQWIEKWKVHVLQYVESTFDVQTTAWITALIFGDRSMLSDDVITLFQRWNLTHILAISGLHTGILVTLIYFSLVRSQLLTKEQAETFIILLLPLYALMVGDQPSVWRAAAMIVFLLIIKKWQLQFSLIDIISIVFIAFLIYNPYMIFHLGFQFSFAVTFAILISQTWLKQTSSYSMQLLKISFLAQMVVLPIQVNQFYVFQPLSILLNMLVVPYFTLIIIPFLCFLLLSSFYPIIMLEKLFLFLHTYFLKCLAYIDTWLYYPLIIGDMPLHYVYIYYGLFLFGMYVMEKGKQWQAFHTFILLIVFCVFLAVRSSFSPVGTVTMLDIGQGDSFVIELPYRKGVFMVDAGAMVDFASEQISDSKYKQIIEAYLQGNRITEIDTIFLSHEHADHDGSISFILENIYVKELVISNYYPIERLDISNSLNKNIRITTAKANEIIERKGQRFYVLGPQKDYADANNNSLILYTYIGGLRWLFMGDAEEEAEKHLTESFKELPVDVLKVGHHGSATSTTSLIVEQTNPTYAFISVGIQNRYGHPTEEVLARLVENGTQIYRTDESGAVRYIYSEKGGKFVPFLSK